MRSVYGYVYVAWNQDRSRCYVGQTTKTPAERWAGHVKLARAHKESPKLGNAIRKYERLGTPMVVEQIDTAEDQAELDFLETVYICALDAVVRGYNCQAGGGGGRLLDEEAKERQRAGVKAGHAAMTEEAKAVMRANLSTSNKIAYNRPNVKARNSAGVKAGMAAMTNEAWAETKANMHTGAKARWAREEAAGRVLRSPEVRERTRLYYQEYRARRKAEGRPYTLSPEAQERARQHRREYRARKRAEKASQALAQAPVTSSPAPVSA